MTLPLPGSEKNYTETYTLYSGTTIVAVYTLNGRSPTVSGFAETPGLETTVEGETSWTSASGVPREHTKPGDYFSGRTENNTLRTYTYNPNTVNKIKLTPDITYSGYGSKIVLKINGAEQSTKYDLDSIISIDLDSTSNGSTTFEFLVRDCVGNEASFPHRFKFVAHGTAPKVPAAYECYPQYSGLEANPTYNGEFIKDSRMVVITIKCQKLQTKKKKKISKFGHTIIALLLQPEIRLKHLPTAIQFENLHQVQL